MLPRIVFVGGTLRSGSTLLSRALGSVPGVVSIGEAALTWRALRWDEPCSCSSSPASCPFWSRVVPRLGVSTERAQHLAELVHREIRMRRLRYRSGQLQLPSAVTAELAPPLRNLYLAAAEVAEVDWVIDTSKSPAHLPVALATGLPVDVVHLVRDPRAVAFSESRPRAAHPRAPELRPPRLSVPQSATTWVLNDALLRLARRDPRVGASLQLRYEDLTRRPAQQCRAVVRALGLPGEVPFDGAEEQGVLAASTTHELAGNPHRFERGALPVRADEAWRRGLPLPSRVFVGAVTAPSRAVLARSPGGNGRAGWSGGMRQAH